jgi:PmbA protein
MRDARASGGRSSGSRDGGGQRGQRLAQRIDRGGQRLERMIAETPRGLYVTDLAGFGIDVVSGEFSQQVEGSWIEAGKLSKPVEGITLGGRIPDMLLGIDAVGSDLEFRNNVASPSVRFKELTVGGV